MLVPFPPFSLFSLLLLLLLLLLPLLLLLLLQSPGRAADTSATTFLPHLHGGYCPQVSTGRCVDSYAGCVQPPPASRNVLPCRRRFCLLLLYESQLQRLPSLVFLSLTLP